MMHKIYTENNILYFIPGVVQVDEAHLLGQRLLDAASRLNKPFAMIIDMHNLSDMHTLFPFEERETIKKFENMLTERGRDISVWITSASSVIANILLKMKDESPEYKEKIFYANSIKEAEEIIKTERVKEGE